MEGKAGWEIGHPGQPKTVSQHVLTSLMTTLHWRVSKVIDIYCHTIEI